MTIVLAWHIWIFLSGINEWSEVNNYIPAMPMQASVTTITEMKLRIYFASVFFSLG